MISLSDSTIKPGAYKMAGTYAQCFFGVFTPANIKQWKRASGELAVGQADMRNKDFAMTNFTRHRLAFLLSMEYYTSI